VVAATAGIPTALRNHPKGRIIPTSFKALRTKHVTPEQALNAQIERYRGMSGESRLAVALRLHELSCQVAREGIRRQYPTATSEQVEEHLRRRLELARLA
jgi:hypothetical protein